MRKITIQDIKPIQDVCGQIFELYQSQNLGISIAVISGKSTPHLHKKMEEIYYVLEGSGQIYIENDVIDIKPGDLIEIPKNKYHHTKANKKIKIMVITHPKFDQGDVYQKWKK